MFQALFWEINQTACFPATVLLAETALWPIAVNARATTSIGRTSSLWTFWNAFPKCCAIDNFKDKVKYCIGSAKLLLRGKYNKNSCVYNFVYYLAAYRNYICPCFANCHLSKYSNSLMRHGCMRCQSIHYSECITLGIRVGYLLNYSQCTQCTSFQERLQSITLLQNQNCLIN